MYVAVQTPNWIGIILLAALRTKPELLSVCVCVCVCFNVVLRETSIRCLEKRTNHIVFVLI